MNTISDIARVMSTSPNRCIVCQNDSCKRIGTNRSFGVDILECLSCGFIQTLDVFPETLKKYYAQEYRGTLTDEEIAMLRKKSQEQAASQMTYLQALIPDMTFMNVLEFGAADGELAFGLKPFVKNVYVTEADPQYARLLKEEENLIYIEESVLDTDTYRDFFHLITISHVLEHLINPMAALDRFNGLLKKNGYLFVDIPNEVEILKLADFQAKGHLHYFTPQTFEQMVAAHAGFDIMEMRTCNRSVEAFMASGFTLPEQPSLLNTPNGTVIRAMLKKRASATAPKQTPTRPVSYRQLSSKNYQEPRNTSVVHATFKKSEQGVNISKTGHAGASVYDNRFALYRDLHGEFLEKEERFNCICSETVLKALFSCFKPASMLDVGCGLGTWLSMAKRLGVPDIFGIEGPWLDKNQLRIDSNAVTIIDLEYPFDLKRRFDLVVCMEVAEHLTGNSAGPFVRSLTRHSDVVLFSAAIPYQGGHNHINEQWQPYWVELFETHNYRCFDFLQKQLWDNGRVFGHVRQNMLLFVNEAKSENPRYKNIFDHAPAKGPYSLVHPETHKTNIHLMDQLMQLKQKYDKTMDLLLKGGTFIAVPRGEENLTLKRIASKSETSRRLNETGMQDYRLNNLEAAEAQFQLAIEMDSEYAESYNNLAVLLWENDRPEQAFANVCEAIRRNPDALDTIINFSHICTAIGLRKKAHEALSAYLLRHPGANDVKALLTELEIGE